MTPEEYWYTRLKTVDIQAALEASSTWSKRAFETYVEVRGSRPCLSPSRSCRKAQSGPRRMSTRSLSRRGICILPQGKYDDKSTFELETTRCTCSSRKTAQRIEGQGRSRERADDRRLEADRAAHVRCFLGARTSGHSVAARGSRSTEQETTAFESPLDQMLKSPSYINNMRVYHRPIGHVEVRR